MFYGLINTSDKAGEMLLHCRTDIAFAVSSSPQAVPQGQETV
jgi:hypothetical protein